MASRRYCVDARGKVRFSKAVEHLLFHAQNHIAYAHRIFLSVTGQCCVHGKCLGAALRTSWDKFFVTQDTCYDHVVGHVLSSWATPSQDLWCGGCRLSGSASATMVMWGGSPHLHPFCILAFDLKGRRLVGICTLVAGLKLENQFGSGLVICTSTLVMIQTITMLASMIQLATSAVLA